MQLLSNSFHPISKAYQETGEILDKPANADTG